ncbi:MAG: PAS domain S-box protein [candidate division Zixibacteria bacterium]|nr:PAS domain S-box protein [candidate division Zixibacteria bacterium]
MSNSDSEHNWTQHLFNIAPVGMALVRNRVFTNVNQRFCELFGYAREELIGQETRMCYSDQNEFERAGRLLYEQIGKTGQANLEVRGKRKDGTIIDILLSTSIFDNSDKENEFAFAVIDISERKKAKQKLINEKEFTETAINAQIDTLFIFDPSTGKPIRWNDAFSRISGFSDEEIALKKAPDDWYDEEDIKKISSYLDDISREGHTTVEMSLITKDNKRILTEYQASSIHDEFGNPKYVIAIGRDATRRRQTEKKLESEQYFSESIIQTSPAYFVAIDGNGNTKVMNQTMLKALGYNAEEVIGADYLSTFIPQKDHELLSKVFAKLVNLNEATVNENSILTKDGRELIVEWHGQPVYDSDGRFDFFFGVGIDITERKKAEEEITKFKTISDRANYGTAIADFEGNIIYINECFARMHGLEINEVIGRHLSIFHTDQQMPDVNRLNKELIEKGFYPSTEIWHKKKDGSVFPTMMNATIIKNEINKPLFISASAIDITKRKIAEAELRTAQHFSESIIDSLPGLFYIIDQNTTQFIRRNDAWVKIAGYSDKEIDSMTALDFFAEGAERDKCAQRIQEVYKTGYSTMENNLLTKNGIKIPYYLTGRKVVINNKTYLVGMGIDITERKLAEDAQRESEKKYRLLVENQTDLLIKVDTEGRFQFVSPSYCKLFGKTEEKLIGNTFMPLVHEDDREITTQEMEKIYHPPYTAYIEQRAKTKDGWRWLGWMETAILDDNDNVISIIGVGRDITKRKKMEKALKKSEADLRNILEHSTNAFYSHTPDHIITYFSPQIEQLLGYTPEEAMIKWTLLTSDNPINEDGFEKTVAAIKSGKTQPPYELELLHKNGSRVIVEVREAPLIKDGKTTAIVGALADITERKQAEKALQESETYLQSLFRAAPIGIGVVVDRILFRVNERMCEMIGYSQQDLIGKTSRILYPTDEEFKFVGKEKYAQIKKYGTGTVETHWKHKDGHIIDVLLSSTPLEINDLSVGVTFTALDITDRKLAEQALFERERTLEALINAPTESSILFDTKGKILAINRIGAKRLGKTEADFIGKDIFNYLPSKLAKSRKAKGNRVVQTGQPIRFQDELNGRYFDNSIYPVFNDNDEVTALAMNTRDITRHRQAEVMLRSIVEGTAEATGQDFFNRLVEHLATSLNCRHAVIGVLDKLKPENITTISYWNRDNIAKNFSFDIEGTPCENIEDRNICFYQSQVSKKYPNDKWLTKNKIEAYLGVPILDGKGEPIGILVVMDTREFSDDLIDGAHSLMTIFSSRAAAELERINAEDNQKAIANRLREEQNALRNKNIALKQILEHMETEKIDFRHEISASIEQALMPFVKKLYKKDGGLSQKDFEQFEDIIKSITGTEIDDFKANYSKLTSREMDICDLIKKGNSSQEIADALHLSIQTIQKHRSSIRKKLQIKNKEINLPAYLRYK